ncbi:WD40/YVTN/BNR-like repeat-containing protein, partial [Nocardioides sp.]|uniref:WD40/YVTN/BNR-like repeat-containing protein n=1 Tax=Nocardioides sp. TaxID=35761 RepID=UPI0035612EE7
MRAHGHTSGSARWGLVALLLAAVLVPGTVMVRGSAATAATPHCGDVVTGTSGVWTRRTVPAFPVGEHRIATHAVDPRSPERQYLSNGFSVMGTHDGCTWSEVFRVPESPSARMPASATTDRILEIVVHPRSPDRVWMVLGIGQEVADRVDLGVPLSPGSEGQGDGARTLVVSSRDAGQTWQPMTGPPIEGAPGPLAPAPTSPSVLYLPTASGLHASVDGGTTWTVRPPVVTPPSPQQKPLDAVNSPLLTRVTVDPMDPSVLYGRTSTIVRSSDGGLTWSSDGLPPGHVTGPFVDTDPTSTRRILVGFQAFSTTPVESWWLRRPADSAFTHVPLEPGTIDGVPWRAAWSAVGGELLMATWDRGSAASFPDVSLYRVDPNGAVEDVNDLDLPPVRGLLADDFGGFHLHTAHELVTLRPLSTPLPQGAPQVEMGPFATPSPPQPAPAVLSGPGAVALEPGRNSDITFSLNLP